MRKYSKHHCPGTRRRAPESAQHIARPARTADLAKPSHQELLEMNWTFPSKGGFALEFQDSYCRLCCGF